MDDSLIWVIIGSVLALLGIGGALKNRKVPGPGMTDREFENKVRDRKDELEKKPAGDIVAGLNNAADVESGKQESGKRISNRFRAILERRRRAKRESSVD